MKGIKMLENLSENTKKHYIFYLKKINDGKIPTNINFFKDIDKIKEKIKDYSANSKLLIINAIMSILSKYKSYPYLKLHKIYKRYRDDDLQKDKIKYYETEKTVPQGSELPGVQNILMDGKYIFQPSKISGLAANNEEHKTVSIESIKHPLNRFIYALYTKQTPRRAQDYYAMEIIKNKSEVPEMPVLNYLCEEDKCFVFAKYKTSTKYKIQEIPISDDLWNEYLLYKPTRSEINNRLLQKTDGSPVDNNQFISYHLNKVLGTGKSVNYLRHKHTREMLGHHHKEIQEEAMKMGHSEATNIYYNKYN